MVRFKVRARAGRFVVEQVTPDSVLGLGSYGSLSAAFERVALSRVGLEFPEWELCERPSSLIERWAGLRRFELRAREGAAVLLFHSAADALVFLTARRLAEAERARLRADRDLLAGDAA